MRIERVSGKGRFLRRRRRRQQVVLRCCLSDRSRWRRRCGRCRSREKVVERRCGRAVSQLCRFRSLTEQVCRELTARGIIEYRPSRLEVDYVASSCRLHIVRYGKTQGRSGKNGKLTSSRLHLFIERLGPLPPIPPLYVLFVILIPSLASPNFLGRELLFLRRIDFAEIDGDALLRFSVCLLYTSPSPRDS